ncbi:MAG TPA: PDZ domain-containing protein, partial [Burkholderiaceae bacterium]|nr:PDZ domain-containing protein [Burkholderiaceae bacterium]
PVDDPAVLPRLVAGTKPGEQATLAVLRGGERRTLQVTVGEFPDEAQSPADRLGLSVSELPPEGRKQLGVDYGVVVEQVQGAAAATPIRRGDVIVAVNKNRFRSLEEFRQLLAKAKPGEPVALLVRRGEAAMYVAVTVPDGQSGKG